MGGGCPESDVDLRRREAESSLKRSREALHREKLAREKAETQIEGLSAELVTALEKLKEISTELAASERKNESALLASEHKGRQSEVYSQPPC